MIEKNTLEGKKSVSRKLNLHPLIAFLAVMASLCAIFFVTGISPFGGKSTFVSDLSAQYAPYLVTYRNKILSGSSFSYSFEIGMGKNFLGIFAYYLSSPLNLISLLFPVSMISEAIVLIIMLKLSFAGAFMTALIDYKFSAKTKMSILFGMIYALCAYSMSFIFNFIWLDGFALLPLVILFTEKFSKNIKEVYKLLLVLIVLFLSNYYIAYMVGIFAFFYLIGLLEYRYNVLSEKDGRDVGKKIGVFLAVSVCAAMVCAFLLIPAGLDTIRNGDNFSSFSVTMDPEFPILDLFPGIFLGKLTNITTNLPFIYSSLAVTLLVVLFFVNTDISKALKRRAGTWLGLGVLSFSFPLANMAWQLFDHPNWFLYRYSFLFIFGTILIAFYSFLHIKSLRNKDFLAAMGILFGIMVLSQFFSKSEAGRSMYFQNLIVLLLTALCLWGMSKDIWPKSLSNLQKWGSGILVPIVIVEIVFLAPKVTVGAIWNDTQNVADFRSEVNELLEVTSSVDTSAGTRMEQTGVIGKNIDSLSVSSYTGTNGIGAFCSMSNKHLHHFLKQLGYCTNYNYFSVEHRNTNLPSDSLLGVSYVVSDQKEISGLVPVRSYDRYTLFENPYACSMAFLALPDAAGWDGYSLEKEGQGKDYFSYQEKWIQSLTGSSAEKLYEPVPVTWEVINAETFTGDMIEEIPEYDQQKDGLDLEDVEKFYKEMTYYVRSSAKAPIVLRTTVVAESDAPLYLSVPVLMRSAPVSIFCNGQNIYKEESTSYYSVIVDTGAHKKGDKLTIEVKCDDDAFASFDPILARIDLSELSRQTGMLKDGITDLLVKDGKVTFTAVSDSEKLLVTTIPYEKGWTAKVDGKETDITAYQDAWISIPVGAGTHSVELRFSSPGTGIGVIISALGVILSTAVVLAVRRPGKKSKGGVVFDREEHPGKRDEETE